MSLSITDLYLINAMNDRNNIRTRAQSIQDNFGLKPMEVGEYRDRNGGFGFLKALAWIAGGLIVGALINFAAIGLAVGMVAGAVSMAMQNAKVMNGYSSYLDEVSAQGRAAKERGLSASMNMDYGNGTGKSYAADLAASRQEPAKAGFTP